MRWKICKDAIPTMLPTAETLGRSPIIPWHEPECWKKSWRGIALDEHNIDDGPEVA